MAYEPYEKYDLPLADELGYTVNQEEEDYFGLVPSPPDVEIEETPVPEIEVPETPVPDVEIPEPPPVEIEEPPAYPDAKELMDNRPDDQVEQLPKIPDATLEEFDSLFAEGGESESGSDGKGIIIPQELPQPMPVTSQGGNVEFGVPTAAFSSGDTITLDPCDENGNDNGEANVSVHLAADGSSVTHDFTTNDMLSFVRYDQADANGEDGVLIGFPPDIATDTHTLLDSSHHTDTLDDSPTLGSLVV